MFVDSLFLLFDGVKGFLNVICLHLPFNFLVQTPNFFCDLELFFRGSFGERCVSSKRRSSRLLQLCVQLKGELCNFAVRPKVF